MKIRRLGFNLQYTHDLPTKEKSPYLPMMGVWVKTHEDQQHIGLGDSIQHVWVKTHEDQQH